MSLGMERKRKKLVKIIDDTFMWVIVILFCPSSLRANPFSPILQMKHPNFLTQREPNLNIFTQKQVYWNKSRIFKMASGTK